MLRIRFLCDEEKRQLSTNLAATSALIMICCRRTHVPLLTFVGSIIWTTGAKPHEISRVRFGLSKDVHMVMSLSLNSDIQLLSL